MKYLIQTVCAALICVSTRSYAAQNGVNYDPAHSSAYQAAQKSNDVATMKSVIASDLVQMKKMGFTTHQNLLLDLLYDKWTSVPENCGFG